MDIRVTIFEDNKSLRNSLFQLINSSKGFVCSGAYEDCLHLIDNIADSRPDVVLMDIELPGISGIEGVRMIREKYPELKILMQTIFEDHSKIFQSIMAGASGYILKSTSPNRMLDFIKETYDGGAPMSPTVATKVLKMVADSTPAGSTELFNLSHREKQILSCLVKGMSYKLIADACTISIDTVRGHIRSIYEKLHVHSKGEAIATALKGRLI